MRTKTNRLLMLLVGVAIAGCASQTDRSSSGGGEQAQIERERVRGSSNAVTQEELERRALAKAAAEAAPVQAVPTPKAAPVPEPEKASKPVAVAAAPKDEALPDFPVTKYEVPEEQAKEEEVEDLGPQDDESISAEQDAAAEEESSVGDTTEYDDQEAEAEDLEELGPQDDESISAEQDAAAEEASSVGDTTEYDDQEEAEAKDSSEVEDLGPIADDSGTASYPEDQRAVAENVVGEPKVYVDEVAPPKPATPKPAPPAQKVVSVSFETEPLFSFDKSEIRADQAAKLDEFISSLAGAQYDSIAVVGHADRIGKNVYNQKLSERRAIAVKTYLVNKGVPAGKIQAQGRGQSEPVTGDTCAKSRGKALISCLQPDRRVDVSVNATKQSK